MKGEVRESVMRLHNGKASFGEIPWICGTCHAMERWMAMPCNVGVHIAAGNFGKCVESLDGQRVVNSIDCSWPCQRRAKG